MFPMSWIGVRPPRTKLAAHLCRHPQPLNPVYDWFQAILTHRLRVGIRYPGLRSSSTILSHTCDEFMSRCELQGHEAHRVRSAMPPLSRIHLRRWRKRGVSRPPRRMQLVHQEQTVKPALRKPQVTKIKRKLLDKAPQENNLLHKSLIDEC